LGLQSARSRAWPDIDLDFHETSTYLVVSVRVSQKGSS
jgi:hypothetical protein